MSEVEKLYKIAGVEKILPPVCSNNIKFCKGCIAYIENAIPYCKGADYPPFTAEKQLELIKWLAKHYGNIHILNNASRGFAIGIEGVSFNLKKFEEIIAMVLNTFWQDLTEQERTEIAEILGE